MLASYDKQAVAQRFSYCAARYNKLADLQQISASILLDITAAYATQTTLQPVSQLLDLGCGPGNQTAALKRLSQQYVGVDIARGMLEEAVKVNALGSNSPAELFIQADMDNLPFATAQFELIFSNLAMQWSNYPKQLLADLKRILQPGGTLVFSTVLNDSLQPLDAIRKQLMQHASMNLNENAGVNAQPYLRDWRKWADDTKFTCVYQEQRKITLWFHDVATLMRSVSAIGADQQRGKRQKKMGAREYADICREYERFRAFEGLPLTYEIGYLVLRNE
ncbi:methyltransferase domain-containing protein [Aliidiomarina iranensis]|nr:methyltransferase domain-containing protein [Aliidiomarina iranensis]